MISGVSSGGHIGVAAITALRYAQSDGQDVVMPVRPAEQIYANFRHIQVRPDSRLEDGVPLYKLKILDALIDSLSRTDASRGKDAAHGSRGFGLAALYRPGFLPEPGTFVDLVA
jgi:hypothetical protein